MELIQFSEVQFHPKIIRTNELQILLPSTPVKYYRHGWHSWSLAAWTNPGPIPVPMPTIFHPLQTDAQHVHEKYLKGSWLGAVEFSDGNILLLGALATDATVSLNQNQLSGQSETGEIEWFISFGQEVVIFEEYARQLGKRFGVMEKRPAPRVWCSWYSLYGAIDETVLHKIFDKLGNMPFDVLQVDDGWQKNIGDWEPNEKFSSGMKALADTIKSTGRKAGLWLAPLIASKTSKLFQDHTNWFLRDENGKLVSAGFNWGQPLYALDATRPDVSSWLVALMKQVRAWGFDYVKLDFLYGGALKGKRFINTPREAAYRECLRKLREAIGLDAFLLTCGTPILPALGLCDAMRVGPDVAQIWEKYRDAYLLYNPTTPCAKNSIRTVLHRLWLKSLVHIDPDVVYFESRENSLTREQKTLLQDLAHICNFKSTSDLPQWMDHDELEQLNFFLNTTPKIIRPSRYVFHIDGRMVDFTSATLLPEVPNGLIAIWGKLVGWLGDRQLILKIFKVTEDARLRRKRKTV